MNYIDEIIEELLSHVQIGIGLQSAYALLVLVKGEETTLADVHDAWAVNINKNWDPNKIIVTESGKKVPIGNHWSLIPFDQLPKETQDKDQKFVDAIHATARAMKAKHVAAN